MLNLFLFSDLEEITRKYKNFHELRITIRFHVALPPQAKPTFSCAFFCPYLNCTLLAKLPDTSGEMETGAWLLGIRGFPPFWGLDNILDGDSGVQTADFSESSCPLPAAGDLVSADTAEGVGAGFRLAR